MKPQEPMFRLTTSLVLCLTLCGNARADDFPPRKPGLWQIDMTMSGGRVPPRQMKMCIDAATDAELYKLGMNASQSMCEKADVRRNGSTVTINSVCKIGQSQSTTQAVTKFDGDTAYRTESKTKFDPPMMNLSESTTTQDGKWVSACPADMQPGDIQMPNGIKMNIVQMLSGQKQP